MSTGGPPDDSRLISARLLVELVDNTLDPGYAAAARRRGDAPRRRWYDRPAVALGCLLAGFIVVVGYVHTNRSAPEATKVHDSLVARVRSAQHSADGLAERAKQLDEQLSRTQQQALSGSGALTRTLTAEQFAVGAVPVNGPGLTVTLREPPAATASAPAARGGTTSIEATNILTDRDVRSVVNELWHDGAEAIAVNGVRLTPTSAIRFAGQAVLVDFQPITSPYRIEAIGEPDTLATDFAQSGVASRYQTLVSVDHIGFTFAESQRLSLPASAVTVLHYASVLKRGSR